MKIKSILLVFLLSLFVFVPKIQAQNHHDKILQKDGKVYNCDVIKISGDTVYFKFKVNRVQTKTYILKSRIQSISLHFYEEIKAHYDSSDYYTIQIKGNTTISGKIIQINQYKIAVSDLYLGNIVVNGEDIINYKQNDKDDLFQIKLNNGNILTGKIINRSSTEISIKTDNLGIVKVKPESIKETELINSKQLKGDEYWFSNPNYTRYFFSPTAFNLKPKEGYYQNTYISINSVNVGLTDNFSIGGGVVLPLSVFITPKIGFNITKNWAVSAGTILGIIPGPQLVGIFYGVTTIGTEENNLTIGGGAFYFNEELLERPILTISGMARASKKIAFVTENWIIPYTERVYSTNSYYYTKKITYHPFFSYGLRLMNKKYTFDFAFINSKEIAEILFIGIPYIDFVYSFQK